MAQKDEYRILNEKGKFYQDHDLGLIEIAPGIQQVKILSNKKNLFTSTGNFKIKKNHLAKGILKVEYYSDDIDECNASVRVFVKPKEFEDNKNLILSKQNSIETYRKNLEKVKLKIQELERDQEDEKLNLEALKKGINSSEKTDQLINILETLGYTKQEFLGNFFPQFPEVSKLEDVSYLNTIQSLLDLSDDDLAERYKLNKSQLRFYFYGDEAENRTVFAKESLFGVIGRDKLSSLINAAHSTGVSFLILNRILSKLNNNQNVLKEKI